MEDFRLFTSKEWDADAGLYYYNARWYDANSGRFTSEDPIRDGLNYYVYVNNNPVNFVDPTGLMSDAAALAAAQEDKTIENSDSLFGYTTPTPEEEEYNEREYKRIQEEYNPYTEVNYDSIGGAMYGLLGISYEEGHASVTENGEMTDYFQFGTISIGAIMDIGLNGTYTHGRLPNSGKNSFFGFSGNAGIGFSVGKPIAIGVAENIVAVTDTITGNETVGTLGYSIVPYVDLNMASVSYTFKKEKTFFSKAKEMMESVQITAEGYTDKFINDAKNAAMQSVVK